MATKSIQVRLDHNLKKRVEKVLADIGVDMPTAVRIFFVKVAATGGIPFMLESPQQDEYTPEQIKKLDRLAAKAKRGIGLSGPFTNVDEMIEDLRK
ncbi:type II toxin-antitoxin system RelB/DinJ family antitoxin [Candidatus Peregrinibacteria bacterium]|nr:type II toxin-antitoxin system RelB/DinJ family antitoxin [Candidatus Peregrinibacteria bacterium]